RQTSAGRNPGRFHIGFAGNGDFRWLHPLVCSRSGAGCNADDPITQFLGRPVGWLDCPGAGRLARSGCGAWVPYAPRGRARLGFYVAVLQDVPRSTTNASHATSLLRNLGTRLTWHTTTLAHTRDASLPNLLMPRNGSIAD